VKNKVFTARGKKTFEQKLIIFASCFWLFLNKQANDFKLPWHAWSNVFKPGLKLSTDQGHHEINNK
jgi:hypothetical protein